MDPTKGDQIWIEYYKSFQHQLELVRLDPFNAVWLISSPIVISWPRPSPSKSFLQQFHVALYVSFVFF